MQTFTLLFPLAWRNLWRNPRRTIITLVVVAAGLYSILVFAAIMTAWAKSSRDTTLDLITGSGQIHAVGYLSDPNVDHTMAPADTALTRALNRPEISAWAERVMVPAVVQSEYRTLPLTLAGVDPVKEKSLSIIPGDMAEGSYLGSSDGYDIVLGRHFAERLKTRVGKRVIILAQATDGTLSEQSYTVVGLFGGNQQVEDAYAFVGKQSAQKMLLLGDAISEISFKLVDDSTRATVITDLRTAAPDLDIQPWTKLSPLAAAMDEFMVGFVYVWLWVMFVFMAIGIVNTQLMAVFERSREFGLLQALGMRPRHILIQVVIESGLMIGVGVLIGFVASVLTVLAFAGGIDLGFLARGAEYFGAGRVLYPDLSPVQFIELSLTVWVLGIVVGLWPAQRATRARAADAMRQSN